MRTRTATSSTLGAALALALTLAGTVAPAFAAEPATAQRSMESGDVREAGHHRPPRPAPKPDDGLHFQPDLRVKYVGPDYDNGTYFFRFRVENIGAASAEGVFVDQEIQQQTYDGSIGTTESIGGKQIASIGADEAVEVRVACVPKPGYVCTGASANARVDDELDPSNNKAHGS